MRIKILRQNIHVISFPFLSKNFIRNFPSHPWTACLHRLIYCAKSGLFSDRIGNCVHGVAQRYVAASLHQLSSSPVKSKHCSTGPKDHHDHASLNFCLDSTYPVYCRAPSKPWKTNHAFQISTCSWPIKCAQPPKQKTIAQFYCHQTHGIISLHTASACLRFEALPVVHKRLHELCIFFRICTQHALAIHINRKPHIT